MMSTQRMSSIIPSLSILKIWRRLTCGYDGSGLITVKFLFNVRVDILWHIQKPFTGKTLHRLREELDQGYVPNDQSYVLDNSDVNSDSTIPPTRIEAFELLAEDDVRVLIANSRSTSCWLDPIPTHLLKTCSESLVSVISNIINSSLESGIFPDCWKEAVVIPLLKKPGLESVFKNLRPVSNLAYISKLTERAVFNQIYDHLVRTLSQITICISPISQHGDSVGQSS